MTIETAVGSRTLVMLKNRPEVEFARLCRSCGDVLQPVGSLGDQYVVAFPEQAPRAELQEGLKAPLALALCRTCGLVQLQYAVNPDRLFKKFWYRSGINEQMRTALHDVAVKAVALVGGLEAGDAVCDIGSNDGTLLRMFQYGGGSIEHGLGGSRIHTVGFEPCEEMVRLAEADQAAEVIFNTYFQRGPKVDSLLHKWHQVGFKLIFALAMFYDVDEPQRFLKEVYELLHNDGVAVIQMNHLDGMLSNMAFDNISHEHLCYYSLTSLMDMVPNTGLQILDVETNDVNGGSIRVYFGIAGSNVRPPLGGMQRVEAQLAAEASIHRSLTVLEGFFTVQKNISKTISSFIRTVTAMGQTVYIYGASTRGTTLLQTLDPDIWPLLTGAAERDERKLGRCMVGTWTPIVSETEARAKANYFLMLPWHFKDTILEREKLWMQRGGQFIIPLPLPRVVSMDGIKDLL